MVRVVRLTFAWGRAMKAKRKLSLTELFVKKAQPQDRAFLVWDAKQHGLALRIQPTGARSWKCVYSFRGRPRWLHLGDAQAIGLADAREKARLCRDLLARGLDPRAEMRRSPGVSTERRVAQKALAFLQQNIEPACYLYRHYDPSGELLYVGVSLVPLRRQDQHIKGAAWRDMICRIVIEPFQTREEALAAEEIAIRTEYPKFNSPHNTRRHPLQELRSRTNFPPSDRGAP
jgi:hypothetical protein